MTEGGRFFLARLRQDLAPEAAGRLLVVGVGVVAGDAQEHRRDAEGEGDLAGGDVLGLDEVHVLGRQAHGLPVEAAFEQERAAGVGSALEALLQLGLEAVVLLDREVAVARGVDQGAGGTGRVVEEGLVPAGRRVVDVDGGGGGLDGGEAVVVVGGVDSLTCRIGRTPGTTSPAKRTARPPAVYSKASGQPSGPGMTFMRSGRSACSSRKVPPRATASR